jgi:hypothetical protein
MSPDELPDELLDCLFGCQRTAALRTGALGSMLGHSTRCKGCLIDTSLFPEVLQSYETTYKQMFQRCSKLQNHICKSVTGAVEQHKNNTTIVWEHDENVKWHFA